MQATTRFHDGITNPILQEADFVFHNSVAFHPTNGVFNADADGRDPTIGRFLRRGEFPPTGFFLGWTIVIPAGQIPESPYLDTGNCRVARYSLPARPCTDQRPCLHRCTQEAHMTGLMNHEEVLSVWHSSCRCNTLAAPPGFSGAGSGRSVPSCKKGGWGAAVGRASSASRQTSSAVRAGSSSWSAKA